MLWRVITSSAPFSHNSIHKLGPCSNSTCKLCNLVRLLLQVLRLLSGNASLYAICGGLSALWCFDQINRGFCSVWRLYLRVENVHIYHMWPPKPLWGDQIVISNHQTDRPQAFCLIWWSLWPWNRSIVHQRVLLGLLVLSQYIHLH